jgi:hypothetical protein
LQHGNAESRGPADFLADAGRYGDANADASANAGRAPLRCGSRCDG